MVSREYVVEILVAAEVKLIVSLTSIVNVTCSVSPATSVTRTTTVYVSYPVDALTFAVTIPDVLPMEIVEVSPDVRRLLVTDANENV